YVVSNDSIATVTDYNNDNNNIENIDIDITDNSATTNISTVTKDDNNINATDNNFNNIDNDTTTDISTAPNDNN
ncbi:9877_t:CDS:1, partial [Funneliformis geosporum]